MRRALTLATLMAVAAACAPNPQPVAPSAPALANAAAAARTMPATSIVRVRLKNEEQKQELLAQGFDLFAFKGDKADAVVTDAQLESLKTQKIPVDVISKASTSRGGGLPSGYRNYSQIVTQMRTWASQHPDLVTVRDVGDTYEKSTGAAPGNDILAMSITSQKNPGAKPAMLFLGGVHARELAPVELNLRLAQKLIEGYGKDPAITQQLDTREVVIIPVVNVDGRMQVERGQTMWRKNTHPFPDGAGVDLNRNFDAHWAYQGVSAPAGWSASRWESFKQQVMEPSSEAYSGPGAASEPETQSLQKLFAQKRFTLSVDLHAYGEMMIWPLGFTTTPTPAEGLFKKLHQHTVPRYRGGTSMQLLYPTSGTTKDYAYEKHHSPGFTIEVGSDADGFRPDFGRLDAIWKELGPGLSYLVSVGDNPSAAQ
jgi:predicted deacylase